MKRRNRDATTKTTIVFESLKGKSATAICQCYPISQALHDEWRDQFPSNTPNG